MEFLHSREHLSQGDVVVVNCSHQCNVQLLSDANFARYKDGVGYSYNGGFFEMLPAEIVVPSTGHWNITIDIAGRRAMIEHSITIIRNS